MIDRVANELESTSDTGHDNCRESPGKLVHANETGIPRDVTICDDLTITVMLRLDRY